MVHGRAGTAPEHPASKQGARGVDPSQPAALRTQRGVLLLRPLLEQIKAWHAPVVEAYAMSECPMITSCHAPPGPLREGSVGQPAGMEVVLLDEQGKVLPPGGGVGEIAVRGPHLMDGYEDFSRPTPPRSWTAGSAPAISVRSTTTASCSSAAAARRSSIVAA